MFVAAHFFGWAVKMLMFRDSVLAWTSSIMFEIFEWTMEVWLDNFKECWWDHLILDLFGCNFIGMLIGIFAIRVFNMRKYNWFFEPTPYYQQLPLIEKAKYFFTSREEYVRKGKYHWLANLWTLNSVLWFLMGVVGFIELSYFFNKTNLHLPPPHWLLAVRLSVIAPLCIIASGDYYDYVTRRQLNSMGSNVFMVHAVLILEFMLWYKHLDYDRIFKAPVHTHMQVVWVLITAFIVGCYAFVIIDRNLKKGKPLPKRAALDPKKIN